MTMHCGYLRAGWKGLIVAGLCFIVPAVLITAIFAYAYQRYGQLPQVEPFLYGIKPAILAVVVALMISLGKKSLKNMELGIIGSLAAILTLAGANEILVLYLSGMAGILLHLLKKRKQQIHNFFPVVLLHVQATAHNWHLFWSFLKIGSILYGSGYALFAFLDAELVTRGLISKQQLTDAIAVGQFTPGPVFSSATFIGWQISGWKGAIAATAGIFLPSFIFVAFLHPLIPVLRRSALMSAFLDTVNIVSVAIILAVCVELGEKFNNGMENDPDSHCRFCHHLAFQEAQYSLDHTGRGCQRLSAVPGLRREGYLPV